MTNSALDYDAGSPAGRTANDASRATNNAPGGARTLLAALALLLASASGARAQTIVQEYYVPMPEAQIRTSFLTLAPSTGTTMDSVISIVVAVSGTKVVYDHWEDGYEIDINVPVQASTRIWGDGNNANGIAPGFVNDPRSLSSGTVLALRNLVTLPRNPSSIVYDGRDRMGATRGIVMSRAAWATTPGTVLATAVNAQSTIDWGTSYVMPIGQNVIFPTPLTSSMFEYTSMMIMAAINNTVVQIDTNGDGTVDITTTVNQGESYQVAGGVNRGATVTSTKPVQVQLLTGDIGANYESRSFTIPSSEQWTPQYYSPVGTASDGDATYIFLYNPGVAANTVNYMTRTGSGSFSIPPRSTYTFLAPQNSGTRFTSATSQEFFAVATVGANPSANNVHDWGFALVPTENLTTEAVVGWGPGSSDGSQNGSPVWVTPISTTTVYVDYNGDRAGALTDPAGGAYDVALTLSALEVSRIFEPDRDQTGMRLYTLDGTMITAAWGQDPAAAGPASPYLDMGTTIPNFPIPTLTKTSTLATDVAPAGLSIGDTIEYTITLDNQGLVAIGNAVVVDPLPAALSYVTNSTSRDGTPISDSGVTPFPLDESGYTIPIIPRRGTTSFTFRTVVATAGSIVNTANSNTGATSTNVTVIPPVAGSNQCVIDFTTSGGATIPATSVGAALYVTVTDADANTNSGTAQSFSVVVSDTTSGDLETITLTETGVNTGVFRNVSGLATSATLGLTPNDETLHVVDGDTLSVTYTDPSFGDTCSDSTAVAAASQTKILYLSTDGADSDTSGGLDRIDPVATSDGTTSNTSTLAAPSGGTITISGAATKGKTGATAISGTSQASQPGTTITFSHSTGSGTNTLLLVGVALECDGASCGSSADPTIGTVKFNTTTTLTRLGRTFLNGNDAQVEIWYAFNPPASTTGNIVVTQASPTASMDMIAGAITFAGVDTTQTLAYAGKAGNGTAISIPSTSNTAGSVLFDTISLDAPGTLSALSAPRTLLWNHSLTGGSGNTAIQGAASYTTTAGSLTEPWTTSATTNWAAAGVSVRPAAGGSGGSATFTQSPTLCEALTLPAGAVVSAETYFTGGSLPASPAITAVLKYGATTIATSNAAASNGTKLTFTFPALGSAVTVPSGSALQLVVTNNQSVTFQIQYDSTTKPSFVSIPTSTVIHVSSVGVYDAAYAGGSVVSSSTNGQTLYVRSVVGDPFGAYDINGIDPLTIDGPGVAGDISTTLGAGDVVDTTTCTKTYEYVWTTGSTQGNYNIAVTAKEGYEDTVTDSKSTSVSLTQLDLGTPCTNIFTTGLDGPDAVTYAADEQVCVRVSDLDNNSDPATIQTIAAAATTILSGSGDSEALMLTETGVNTGIFAACIPASSSVAGSTHNGTLYAPLGSSLTGSYTDPDDGTDICGDTGAVPSGSPAITVTKTLLSPTDGQAKVGEAAQFLVRVANTGNTTLSGVAVSDTFPAGNLTYVSASPSPDVVVPGTLSWANVGPLASGASVDLIVNCTASASANPAINSATADAGGGVTGASSASLVISNPSMLVTKTLVSPSPGPATNGDNVVFSIVVQNTGDTTIDTLPLEDTYSGACFTYVSSTPTADGSGYGSILWTDVSGAGSLAPSATATISVTLQATGACDPASNTAAADFVTDTNGDAVAPSSSSATIVTEAVTISGFVYEDQGVAGFGGDVPLAEVTVRLYTDPNGDGDPSDGAIVQVATTLADGSYEFPNLPIGNYVVVETEPLGYDSIADTQGSATDNRIAVAAGTATPFPNNNFLDDLINPANYSHVSGKMQFDTDGDGNVADIEPGIDGAIIDLYTDPNGDGIRSDGVLFLTTATAGGGLFVFSDIPPGYYVIRAHDPAGYPYSSGDSQGLNDDLIAVYAPPAGTSTDNIFLETNIPTADLAVVKAGPTSLIPGTNVVYTITVTNQWYSDAPAAAVSVADPTPSGLTFVSNAGDCTSAYPCSLGGLAAGQTRTITTTYSVPASYTTPNPVLNTATVSATTLDPAPGDNTSTSLTPVVPSADVAVDKTGPASVTPGINAVYTITVTNNGSSDAAAVTVTDPTPSGLTFVSNTGDCTTVYPCSLGTVPAGATRTVTTTYSVPSSYTTPDPIVNTATVSTSTGDPTPGNNTSTSSTPLLFNPDVSVTKSGPASVTPGASAVYTITVTNDGTSDAAAVIVADPTPTGLTFVSNTGDCVTAYPCALGTLTPGATRTITTTYAVPASYTMPDPVVNTATVSTSTPDPTPGDDSSTSSTPVAASADLELSKSGPASVTPGGNVVYTIIVTNHGVSDAAAVTVSDPTPGGLSFVSNAGDCVSAYPCALGVVAAGAARTITTTYAVPASYTTPDPVVNTATVSSTTIDPTPANNTDSASSAVMASADLSISKIGPGGVKPGTNLAYTITVTNNGSSDATGVSVADPTPSGLTFVSNTGDCTTAFPCAIGALAAGASVTIHTTFSVPLTYTTPDPIVNTATVTSTTSDPDAGNNSSTHSDLVTAREADLAIVKTGPASATAGDTIAYTITVTNNGPDSSNNTTVDDTTPPGLTFVSNAGACTGAFPCLLGTIASGDTRTITTTFSIPASYAGADPISNTAQVGSDEGDPDPSDDSSTASTPVSRSADLSVVKAAPASIVPGTDAVYTITVTNSGLSDAAAVSVADPTPAGLTFVSNAGHCATAYPCSLGTVPAGATHTITTTYSVPSSYSAPDPVVNTATVSSTTTDPTAANDTSTTSTPVAPSADVAVHKTGPASIVPGVNALYTITVTNNGSSDAAAVSVADPTPSGLTFVSNTGDCVSAYPCALGTVPPGAARTITTTYSVPASYTSPDPVVNTATVSTTTSDPDAANDTSTTSTPIAASADVAVTKTGPASLVPGTDAVYTITITNNGSSDAAAVSVADPTPTGLTFVSNTGDCVSAYPCALGTVPAGATRSITTTYSVPASYTTPDPVLNTTTVSTTTTDPTPANDAATSSTPVAASADVVITKTGAASIVPGVDAVYTITVTNNGVSDAAAVSVADPTPAGLTFFSNTGDCATAYPCSLGTLPAGASRTITTTYVVPASYTTPDPVVNTATVSTTTTDPTPGNNTSAFSTPVAPSADVSVVKTGPASVTPGSNAIYTITVTNNGSSDAAAVSVADPMPSGLTFVSNANACNTAFPCALGIVPAGATRNITTTYSVPASYTAPDPVVNTATVSSTTSDPTPGNNSSTSSAPITPSADVSVTKTGPAWVVPGTDAVYTITVTNNGTSDATAVSVTDPTPSGLTFVSNAGDCGSAYPCALGTVAVGATRTITTTYSVPASYTTPDPVVNTATVSTTTSDPTPANNASTSSTPVAVSADVSVVKTGPASVVPGSDAVYTITVTNNGSSDAAAVSVDDTTPSGLTFVSNTGHCVSAYPCVLGTLPAGATRTITTTYSVPASYTTPDPVVNTATVSTTTSDPSPANNASTSSTPVSASADVLVIKTGPPSIVPGSNAVYTITVINGGISDAAAVSVADPTPAGLTFVSNTGDCVGAYPCALGIVPSEATRTITTTYSVPASYTTPDPVVNTATVSSPTADPTPGNNTSTSSIPVAVSADVSVAKSGPATFTAGGNVVYTITVTNSGPSGAAGVSVDDPTPTGLTFVSNSGACATAYPCSLATVPAGTTRTITSTYAVPLAYSGSDPLVNTATVSSTTGDPTPGNNSASASSAAAGSVSGVVFHDLDSDGFQDAGETGLLGVTVTLTGPSCLAGCIVTTGADGNYSFTGLAFGDYTLVETDPADYTSTTPNSVPVTVAFSASSVDFGDLYGGGDTGADLAIVKDHTGYFETCGSGLYTLRVDNLGPDASGGLITVTDTLPAGLTYVSAVGSGWTCGASAQVVTCATTNVIAMGAASAQITLAVNVAEAAYPTVNNTASVSSLSDPNPVNDTASHGVTVRIGSCDPGPQPETCSVSLKKVHSGNASPGGEIQYTLQWSSACKNDLTDVTVSDPVPPGLTVLSATSFDATSTISGNTVTFHMPVFTARTTGKGFITVRVDPDAAPGTGIKNVATLSDAVGHSATANNFFRVRGGSTDSKRLSCFVRGQTYARPGRYVKYEVRYKNGSASNDLTLTLPEELSIDSVFPEADWQEGNTLYWGTLARTSGKVTVNTLVSLTAQDQAAIIGSATMSDGAQTVAVCEQVSVISRYEKLFASLKAQSHTRPGATLRYSARYREAVGSNQMVVSLPSDVTVLSALPAPNGGTDNTLIWNDLPLPSGMVKIDATVKNVPGGTVLAGSLTLTDASMDVVSAEAQSIVGTSDSTSGGQLAFKLSALRSVTAGTTTDISVRYQGVQAPGSVMLELPPELTPVLAVPKADFSGNMVIWPALTSDSGLLKLRVAVDPRATSGQSLVVDGFATDGSGAVATMHATTMIRDNSTSSGELSMAVTLPRTVTKGLTTTVYASYDGLQGSGQLTMWLPVGMTLRSTVPSGAQVAGNAVTWAGLGSSSGSVRANVVLSGSLVSGSTLSVEGMISSSNGATAGAADTASVR